MIKERITLFERFRQFEDRYAFASRSPKRGLARYLSMNGEQSDEPNGLVLGDNDKYKRGKEMGA